MKPIIPKSPEVPKEFSNKEISFLTQSVFGKIIESQPCDVYLFSVGLTQATGKKLLRHIKKVM